MWVLRYVAKAVLLAAVGMVTAQEMESARFTFPQADTIVLAGTDMTIAWTATSPGSVTLVLQAPEAAISIASDILDIGNHTWRIPPDIKGIFELIAQTSSGTITSEPFTIMSGSPPPLTPPPGGAATTMTIIATSTLTNTTHTATATKKPPSITDTTLLLDVSSPTAVGNPTMQPPPPLITTDTVLGDDAPPPAAVIAGATVGAAVGAALILASVFLLWRRRQEKLREGEVSDGEEQRNQEMITRGMGAYPGRQFGGGGSQYAANSFGAAKGGVGSASSLGATKGGVGSQYAASSFGGTIGGVGSQYAASFKTAGSLNGMEQYAGTGGGGRENLDEYGRTKGMVNGF